MAIYTDRAFLDIVNRLSPSVPGCPTPVIEQYVRDAAIEACERTLAWRYEQPAIRLVTGLMTMSLILLMMLRFMRL